MGAKVESAGNDVKGISSQMQDLGAAIKRIEAMLGDIKKLQATISKKPDECLKPVEELMGNLVAFPKLSRDFDGMVKYLKTAVAK